MKRLLLFIALLPSLTFAGECPWTVRGAIRDKDDALKKCGPPDFVNSLGSYGDRSYQQTDEEWVYFNQDGTRTVIRFAGKKKTDFDRKR